MTFDPKKTEDMRKRHDVPGLIGALGEGGFNRYAACALGRIGDARAEEPLLNLFDKVESLDRNILIDALRTCGRDRTVDFVSGILAGRSSIKEGLGLGKRLTDMMQSSHQDSGSIKKMDDSFSQMTISNLISLLVSIGSGKAAEALFESCRGKTLQGCSFQMIGLSGHTTPQFHEAILRYIHNDDRTLRLMALVALSFEKNVDNADTIASLAEDPDQEVRVMAAHALAVLHDRRALPLLLPFLESTEPAYRAKALGGLAELDSNPDIERFLGALKDHDPHVRTTACLILGKLGDIRTMRGIQQLVDDPSPAVRSAAYQAIGMLGDLRAHMWVFGSLENPQIEKKFLASMAILEMRLPGDSDLLMKVLKDPFPYARVAALFSLGKIKERRAVPMILLALNDGLSDVRRQAINALAAIGDPKAIEPLMKIASHARDDSLEKCLLPECMKIENSLDILSLGMAAQLALCHLPTACSAIDALARLGDKRSVPAIRKALKGSFWNGPEPEVQIHAARALGKFRDVGSIEPLSKVLDDTTPIMDHDKELMYAACQALGEIGDSRALPLLNSLVDDRLVISVSNPDIEKLDLVALGGAAREAINKINTPNRP